MNIIFTDIDGVLNYSHKNQWIDESIDIYNRLCEEFDLKPVITSTWRTNHTKKDLQHVFNYYGITTPIYDFTPVLPGQPRGVEIETWISENSPKNWIVIDDQVTDILPYVINVVKVRGWIGLSEEEYTDIKRIVSTW